VSRAGSSAQRFPRADRLRRRAEFLRVQREGKRVTTPHFAVMVLRAERQRFGVTVTRRVAGAVGRNRIKRLARELFRRERALFPPLCDVVLVARTGAERLDYATLREELAQARAALMRASSRSGPTAPNEARS
jgi:ribonuclease P protein component